MEKNTPVHMRMYANWEMDRAAPSAIQRSFNLSINRLVLNYQPAQINNIVITAKLQDQKRGRSLRSNEIAISSRHGRVDVPLDLSFTIQYPHFLKRKTNTLHILIQRRRKYKNRLPGGFKTLAVGMLNLTQILQQGGLRELPLWTAEESEKDLSGVQSVGRLYLTNCQSLPLEMDSEKGKKNQEGEISEEETDSEYEDLHMDTEIHELSARSDSRRIRDPRINSKLAHRKNIKQRFVSLLRKFKVPEDEASAACSSVARAPTAKELEALFEELEGMSDSGPEMAADEISISSNPRPALRPYFTRSKEILPAIYDPEADIGSDRSESEGDESSSEVEHQREKENRLETPTGLPQTPKEINQHRLSTTPFGIENKGQAAAVAAASGSPPHFVSNNGDGTLHMTIRPSTSITNAGYGSQNSAIPHSITMGSISREKSHKDKVLDRVTSLNDQLSSTLLSDSISDCIWLCNLSESTNFTSFTSLLNIVNCPTASHTKQAIGQIVNNIQNFCDSNSVEPSLTYVGIAGGDRLLGQVLRAYVDCMQHKSSSNWLQYIRFILLPYPQSLCSRLIEGIDPQMDELAREVWEKWAELSPADRTQIAEKLGQWGKSSQSGGSRINLPIGEVMIQVSEATSSEPESGLIFVPFLSEIRVGASEESTTDSEGQMSSPRGKPSLTSETINSIIDEKEGIVPRESGASPPNSPMSQSAREMAVEYWANPFGENVNFNSSFGSSATPPSKKDNSKASIKSTFRSLVVHRSHNNSLLSMSYVKEKKKDKMLHKLGMKKGQKSDTDMSPVQIFSITRVLCSPTSKHHSLNVFVDGCLQQGVRYFQASAQWQKTHIRVFPLTLFSHGIQSTYHPPTQ